MFNFGNPWNSFPQVCRLAADGVAFPGYGPCLQDPAPSGLVADVGAEVVAPSDADHEGVVHGDEHDALSSLGVHNQLPQIFRDWNFVFHEINFLIVHLG